MRLLNKHDIKVGDVVEYVDTDGVRAGRYKVARIEPASETDWNKDFRGKLCVWSGHTRWPIDMCRKVEQ